MPNSGRDACISATTGREAGWLKLKHANMAATKIEVIPFARRLVYLNESTMSHLGLDTKSIVVEAGRDVSVTGNYRHASFSPLPISLLGKKYILPFCCDARRGSSVVIATHEYAADVHFQFKVNNSVKADNKTYKNGDVLTKHLQPYETYSFTFDADISGSVIESSSTIGVFLATTLSNQIDTYDQLPPTSLYDKEYIVAVVDHRDDHSLMIVGEDDDTTITFSDGLTLSGSIVSRTVSKNETLRFTSTKPVMATLCRNTRSIYYSAFVIIPPVSAYRRTKTSLYIPFSKVTTTVKILAKTATYIHIERYTEEPVDTHWLQIPGTDFKVGTCKVQNLFATSFDSNDSFNILAYSNYFIQNGGFGGSWEEVVTSIASTTTRASTTTDENAPSYEKIIDTDEKKQGQLTGGKGEDNRPVIIVAVICGLLIVALVAVISTLATRLRRSRSPGRGQQKSTLVVSYRATPRTE